MIEDLLPQKDPIVMVSSLKDDNIFLEIKDDNIFLDNNIFQEAGILEHIAQAVIVYMYNKEKFTSIQPKIGKISNTKFEREVHKGEILETKINIRIKNDDVLDLEAISFVYAERVASTEMLLIL
ncbi:MAG: hypothetical protein LBG80_12455 [Bacteroidales bacterium]|jgi:hypothetical protein|nr:hypothetical protein [Bacteroidales bacterium]